MKFGIFDHMDRAAVPLAQQFEERLRLIENYERAGFYAYHIAEHHATPLGMAPAPSVFLAAVAQRTKRLRFGPVVYPLTFHHPLRVAEEICMLDHLSGGRLELGVGRGASPHEMRYYGVDPAHAQAIYHEAFAILMAFMTSRTLTHAGKHFQFTDVPVEIEPLQRPYPPLWYGLAYPDGAVWPARNKVNVVCNGTATAVRAITDRYRAEWLVAGNAAGEIPLMGMSRFIVIADSSQEALEIARRGYRRWYESFFLLWARHGTRPVNAAYPDNFDDMQRSGLGIAGTSEMVRDALISQIAAARTNYQICRFAFGDLTLDESMRSLDQFARSVMPALMDTRQAAE
jgi:alkanesulfonate monooxygenase SsuD/methylene tetrahydromethanopterin reductase-like flavin-dependent oxidoreductase (luciferase family)